MTKLTNEQIEQILEGYGVKSGSLGSVIVDCDNDPIEYTEEYSTYNLNLLREILSLRQEVGRLYGDIEVAILNAAKEFGKDNLTYSSIAIFAKRYVSELKE